MRKIASLYTLHDSEKLKIQVLPILFISFTDFQKLNSGYAYEIPLAGNFCSV